MAVKCRQGRLPGNQSLSFVDSQSHVVGNAALSAPNQNHQCSIVPSGVELKCGCRIPVMGNLCVENYRNLPMFDGYIGKPHVAILRDTCCSCTIVKKSLVEPSEFTAEKPTFMMIDRSLIQVPTAMCNDCAW